MRPIIVKLARMLTDCMDAKMGLVRMDESRWEYKMLDALLTDEQAELMSKDIKYAMRVDTSVNSPAECAEQIVKTLFE